MPLLKRKPYGLSKPPDDLKPQELVFQIRFTKEIFRDYEEYLKRINLYRQRVWTCKVTGKTGLTYEEALVSECRATEQVQQFPKEFMGPVLRLVQLSTLRLDELVNMILKAFKDNYLVGEELMCIQGNSVKPCKVMKIITPGVQSSSATYEVGWLDNDKCVTKTSRESADRLFRKKPPFTRALLKSFIRESVSNNVARNAPWMVHEKLCHKYKIAIEPPEELKTTGNGRQSMHSKEANGNGKRSAERVEPEVHVYVKRRKKDADGSLEPVVKLENEKAVTVSPREVEPIRYPIEDTLVKPSSDDPSFTERPVPSTDFPLPMDCIGRLLMVWNFCVLFGKVVQLYPFSLEEFEKTLQCKEGDPVLLREAHHALIQAVLNDPVMHQLLSQKRKRKAKVSFQTWKDDLSDVLELEGFESLAEHSSAIREGKYRLLEPSVKLDILCELVDKTVASSAIREHLDLIIEEKQAIAAQKRKEVKEHLTQVQGPDSGQKTTEASTRKQTEDEILTRHGDDQQSSVKRNLTDGTCENGGIEDNSTLAFARLALKAKGGLKQKEEKDKENKRIEEQKSSEKKRHGEELKQQKSQEKKMMELQKRQEQLDREIEKRIIRTNPLGRDRDYNRYWFFPREGRIFVEDQESKRWGYYGAKEELEALFGSLNSKGVRERALHRQLEKQLNRISDALQKRSKEIAQRIALEDTSIRRSSRVKSSPHQQTTPVYKNKYRTM